MEHTNGYGAVDEIKASARPILEDLADSEKRMVENDSMTDMANNELRPTLRDEIQDYLQESTDFDPHFDPEHAPRIALLCQTCHTALHTAICLAQHDTHKRKLTSGALRVRIWGMDMFDPTKPTTLDELLSLTSGNHKFLRNHLMGIWADIAVTLELILCLLIRQTKNLSPESCTQLRRLRIVLGLDDVSIAVHQGFSLPGSLDRDLINLNDIEVLDSLISSLEELVDCLFDLLVSIGTTRQLYMLSLALDTSTLSNPQSIEHHEDSGSKKVVETHILTSSASCNLKDQGDGDCKNTVETSQASDHQAQIAIPSRTSSPTSEDRRQVLAEADPERVGNEGSQFPESAVQDVLGKHFDRTKIPSNAALRERPKERRTGADGREGSPDSSNKMETLESIAAEAQNSTATSVRVSVANHQRYQKPIKFIDCYSRISTIPFTLCRTWEVSCC